MNSKSSGRPFFFGIYLYIHKISECYPSPHNGLTMCVGSYASRSDNDINTIVSEFARNVSYIIRIIE